MEKSNSSPEENNIRTEFGQVGKFIQTVNHIQRSTYGHTKGNCTPYWSDI